jgi:integrase
VSIRRHGNRWQVRIRTGDGRRVEQTLPPGATEADARALEATLKQRIIAVASGRRPDYLIAEAIDRWISTEASALRGWADLRYRVQIVQAQAGKRTISALPDLAAELARQALNAGAKNATVNQWLAICRRLGNLCERWGWTDQPLGRRIQMLPVSNQRHRYLTAAQVKALALAAGGEAGDAITMLALTGLRRGELLRLTPAMITDGCVILDSATKSGRPRVVPLPPEAARIAARRLPWQINARQLRAAWQAATKAAELSDLRIHDLRHTYASWLAQAGAPMTAIRDLLGHSNLSVTSRYAHLARPDLRRAVDSLGSGWGQENHPTALSV